MMQINKKIKKKIKIYNKNNKNNKNNKIFYRYKIIYKIIYKIMMKYQEILQIQKINK